MTGIVIAGVAHSHVDCVTAELRERSDLTLLGVYDPDPQAAARVAAEFDAPVCASAEELFGRGAEIVACAGVYSHRAALVVGALEAGADVVCDKPLCIDLVELDEIESAIARSGRQVALMLEKRTYPETRALTQALTAGRLGEPVSFASWAPHKLLRDAREPWFLDPSTYGGILADLLVHDVDIALQITGATRGSVRGWLGPTIETGFALQGGATVTFGDAGSPVLSAEVDWLTPAGSSIHGDYRMRVVGTAGTAELYWGRGRLELTTTEEPCHDAPLPGSQRPAQDAFDAVLTGGPRAVTATRDTLRATRIALLAEQSARSGGVELSWEVPA